MTAFRRVSNWIQTVCIRKKNANAEGTPGADAGEPSYLTVRAFQSTTHARVPKTTANETHKVSHWNNSIRTSLYRWWNFLPLNLFQQLIIPSNTYFLVMAILQMIKPISDSGGVPTFLLPIGVVISVTMLKDAYEDISRHRSDKLENTRLSHVLGEDGVFHQVEWRTLKPGDVVQVKANEQIPADLVVLTCADPYGICYLETVQLDGETNLKGKTCLAEFQEMFPAPSSIASARLEITYGCPDAQLYSFRGTLRLYSEAFSDTTDAQRNTTSTRETLLFLQRRVSDEPRLSKDSNDLQLYAGIPYVDFPVSINQFLWRGTTLSNTEWIVGLVVYTGRHTRIFRNTKSRRLKYSQLLKTYNKHALVLAGTQFLLCLFAAIFYAIEGQALHTRWYLIVSSLTTVISSSRSKALADNPDVDTPGLFGFLSSLGIGFGRYALLLSYFVPITLFVQLEIVKWFQAYFFIQDKEMHTITPDSSTPRPTTSVQTVSLMEELGNVTHVFTDKTGTLTLNLMQLRCMGIGDTLFGFGDSCDPTYDPTLDIPPPDSKEPDTTFAQPIVQEGEKTKCVRRHNKHSSHSTLRDAPFSDISGPYVNKSVWSKEDQDAIRAFRRTPNPYVDFDAWLFLKYIEGASDAERKRIKAFLLVLSICHSVLPKNQSPYEEYAYPQRSETVPSPDIPAATDSSTEAATAEQQQQREASASSSSRRLRCIKRDPLREQEYDASSPDERAIICGALHLGLEFLHRPTLNTIQIGFTNSAIRRLMLSDKHQAFVDDLRQHYEMTPLTERFPCSQEHDDVIYWPSILSSCSSPSASITPSLIYDVLEVLEFDNVRKKMSVVLRDSDGTLLLLTKGADTSMIHSAAPDESAYIDNVLTEQLSDLSHEGLRTLVFGYRALTWDELTDFRRRLAPIRMAGEPDAITDLYNTLERDLTLVGCTGIDDKLQPAVPNVIEELRHAGIKVWVLTGDKLETAVSIGHSCHVLTDTTYNAIINGKSEKEVTQQLQQYMSFIVAGQLASAAFDQLTAQQTCQQLSPSRGESVESSKPFATTNVRHDGKATQHCSAGCMGRVVTSLKALSCTRTASTLPSTARRRKRGQRNLPTMRWDDFVKMLLFQAKHTPVMSQPQQSAPVQLTSEQVEGLVQEYLRSFHRMAAPNEKYLRDHRFSQHGSRLLQPADGTGQTCHTSSSLRTAHSGNGNKRQDAEEQPNVSSLDSRPLGESLSQREVQRYTEVAITCTGEALSFILNSEYIKHYFFGLANLCTTVIACRVTPKQKAEVVRQSAVYLPGTVSLAIGDGANDVGMIITANVGVGITGQEGVQATRAADFAIGEFRVLRHILFHHGHENLRRNSFQVYHTMYKNVLFGLADWTFGFFSMFTATDLYSIWLKQILNLLFTPFPSLILSIFDRRLPADIYLSCPWLYPTAQGQTRGREMYFGNCRFAAWLAYGFYSALLVTMLPLAVIANRSLIRQGLPVDDIASFGHLVFWLVVVVSNLTPVPFFHTWYWFAPIGYSVCFTVWFLSWSICSSGISLCGELASSLQVMDSSMIFHAASILTVSIVLLPLVLWWFLKSMFFPDAALIIRERIALGVFDVVVAPKQLGGLGVIVPRQENKEEWHGFAFSEDITRLQFHRRFSILPKTVITRTAALRTAAGGILQGRTPASVTEVPQDLPAVSPPLITT